MRLKGVELCEPCSSLGYALASATLSRGRVVDRLLHRAGLRADVLTSGEMAVGADVTAI